MKRTRTIVICAALFLLGCQSQLPQRDTRVDTPTSPVEIAEQFAIRGDYLLASYFLEAALQNGADEALYLPKLAYCQIRAGRLLASLASLKRLVELQPDNNDANDLYRVVRKVSGRGQTNKKEAPIDSSQHF